MKDLIEQFIDHVEQDQKLSFNTKIAYRSDLLDLLNYVTKTNTQVQDINQEWVKNYVKYLEDTNKERNSFNRRASTFRIFLRFLYRHKLIPTNYSLIVNNRTAFLKSFEEPEPENIKKLIDDTKLTLDQKLILHFISKLGLSATEIVSLNTFQVDFENRVINLSDLEKIDLPDQIFKLLREYLIEVRAQILGAQNCLSLFLSENGRPLIELDIYKLVRKLSKELSLPNKLTTRNLKRLRDKKIDVIAMQREIFSVIAPTG